MSGWIVKVSLARKVDRGRSIINIDVHQNRYETEHPTSRYQSGGSSGDEGRDACDRKTERGNGLCDSKHDTRTMGELHDPSRQACLLIKKIDAWLGGVVK